MSRKPRRPTSPLPPAADLANAEPVAPAHSPANGHEPPDPAETARRQRAIDMLAMIGPAPEPAFHSWEETIGIFDDDPLMQEIFAEAVRIREASRPRE